ncbi:hypothetical protein BJ741DRAFT_630998 [Chytriomyces cf. hyalinus JEL632]|nr:hypothetical protein BJ741DRAFT_630998 [Chytriomyces cf. hyalinus JEL632]
MLSPTPPVGLFSSPMVKTGFPLSSNATNDGCTPYPPLHFFGYAALIRRGECLFSVKAANAMQAGATTVIFYNNDGDAPIGPVGSNTSIPVYTISQFSGKYIMDALAAQGNGNGQLSFSREDSLFYSSDSNPRVSNVSSWGLNNTCPISSLPQHALPQKHDWEYFPTQWHVSESRDWHELTDTPRLSAHQLALSPPISGNRCLHRPSFCCRKEGSPACTDDYKFNSLKSNPLYKCSQH